MRNLFDRSRITFYSAEGLKELARDHMADVAFFTLFLAVSTTAFTIPILPRPRAAWWVRSTIQAAQSLQLGAHVLEPHTTTLDREGVCHHLANNGTLTWRNK